MKQSTSNEAVADQEKVFSQLIQDAVDITEELDDLQKYLAIDAKTPTINEYQIFKTLYLKHKVESCLEQLKLLKNDHLNQYSQMLFETNQIQFEKFKQVIHLLDLSNRNRKISMMYTGEEAKFIRAWEDKKEKQNPERTKYPIQTRITAKKYVISNKTKRQQRKAFFYRGIIIVILMIISYLIYHMKAYWMLMLTGAGIFSEIVYGLKKCFEVRRGTEAELRNHAIIVSQGISEQQLQIKKLTSAAKELRNDICYYQGRFKGKVKGRFKVPELPRNFEKYDDYDQYVQLYLLSEKLNAKLIEQGITRQRIQEELEMKQTQYSIFRWKIPKREAALQKTRGIESNKERNKNLKNAYLRQEMNGPQKNINYTATKAIRNNMYTGKRGR